MSIDPNAVGATSPLVTTTWGPEDCQLYALGVGASAGDPTEPIELRFTTEGTEEAPQEVFPTFALSVTLGESPLRAVGSFDWSMIVNAEQRLTVHGPLPVAGHVCGRTRVAALYDKGTGTLAVLEGEAWDLVTGRPMWTSHTGIFIRGEGGWGGDRGPSRAGRVPPDRTPDHVVTLSTRPDQALLYRLTGDRTPLHSDPSVATRAGFPRPILQGRCTMGFTGRALLHLLCGSDPARFRSIDGRFSAPVTPGDTLTVSIWVTGDHEAEFRTSKEDGTVVLDAGRFERNEERS